VRRSTGHAICPRPHRRRFGARSFRDGGAIRDRLSNPESRATGTFVPPPLGQGVQRKVATIPGCWDVSGVGGQQKPTQSRTRSEQAPKLSSIAVGRGRFFHPQNMPPRLPAGQCRGFAGCFSANEHFGDGLRFGSQNPVAEPIPLDEETMQPDARKLLIGIKGG
jgi:hypothetical protein